MICILKPNEKEKRKRKRKSYIITIVIEQEGQKFWSNSFFMETCYSDNSGFASVPESDIL